MIVYAVHSILADEVRPTELLCSTERSARQHAAELSQDPGVLAAGVVEFRVDELGTRRRVALYVDGQKQTAPYVSDDRRIFAGGAHRSP